MTASRGPMAQMAVLLSAVLWAGCSGTPPATLTSHRVEFVEATGLGVGLNDQQKAVDPGGIVSVRIGSIGSPAKVVSVSLIVDPGLDATFLGYAPNCLHGCVGAEWVNADSMKLAMNSLSHSVPFVIPVENSTGIEPPAFVFLLKVDPAKGGVTDLAKGCLRVTAARLRLTDGAVVTATPGDTWVAGIQLSPAPFAAYKACR